MRFIGLSWITTGPGRAWVGSVTNKHNPSTESGLSSCISSRITTVIHVGSDHQVNYNCFNEPFAVSPYRGLYWDMHGLIFETSIWLLAGSTRFMSDHQSTPISANLAELERLSSPTRWTYHQAVSAKSKLLAWSTLISTQESQQKAAATHRQHTLRDSLPTSVSARHLAVLETFPKGSQSLPPTLLSVGNLKDQDLQMPATITMLPIAHTC